ncbi:MAG TPA: DUF3489 domain-containing protein [Pseudoxanthomonas sp.]|nr:DUF3489 domain-containing protein [Pseudoxanthomonas sp.]
MSTFTIDDDNNIMAYASAQEASQGDAAGLIRFDSQATLAKASTDWPMSRLVEIWNGIPGQSPVKKFQDRKKAVARVWAAIQPLAGHGQPSESAAEKPEPQGKAGEPAKKAKAAQKTPGKWTVDQTSDRGNKKAEVIAMMKRATGATLAEIMQATGWQKHTIRGFVSILGSKGGLSIESSKNAAGERTYKIAK